MTTIITQNRQHIVTAEVIERISVKEDTVYKRLGRLKQKIKKLLG